MCGRILMKQPRTVQFLWVCSFHWQD